MSFDPSWLRADNVSLQGTSGPQFTLEIFGSFWELYWWNIIGWKRTCIQVLGGVGKRSRRG